MSNIAVIIPLHEYNDDVKVLLLRAIDSVPSEYEVRVSCRNGLSESIKKACKTKKNVVIYESENADSPYDFCTLVNQAVGGSDWFSVLEYDDVYTDIWFDNFKKYADYYTDVSVFTPLEDLLDYTKQNFIGIGNESVWASSFSNELGYIDNDCLQNFFDFYMTGSIFRTDDWIEIGGLKPKIKLTFWYEFLLRATHNGKKIYVIPKVGYKHYLGRNGSLVESYRKSIDEDESNFWVKVAKKEYFFKEERDDNKYLYSK